MAVKKKQTKTKKQVLPKNPFVDVTCILSGKNDKIKYLQLAKQASKLKFDSVESYVKYYVTKECILLLRQGYTEKQIRDRYECIDKTQVPLSVLKLYVKKFKNRAKIEKLEKRKEVQEYIKQQVGAYIVKPHTRNYIDLTSPSQVAELTKSSCLRPDIYLNNSKACNGCHIYKLCKCAARKWNDKLDEPVPVKKKKK
jgi:hypothetical protein